MRTSTTDKEGTEVGRTARGLSNLKFLFGAFVFILGLPFHALEMVLVELARLPFDVRMRFYILSARLMNLPRTHQAWLQARKGVRL